MHSPAISRTWGPSFRYALPMVVIAFGIAWATWSSAGVMARTASAVKVTALKPVIDDIPGGGRPVEVAYGVPSERTEHLWRPFWPPAR